MAKKLFSEKWSAFCHNSQSAKTYKSVANAIEESSNRAASTKQ